VDLLKTRICAIIKYKTIKEPSMSLVNDFLTGAVILGLIAYIIAAGGYFKKSIEEKKYGLSTFLLIILGLITLGVGALGNLIINLIR
jgi:hypothetical protein